MGWLAQRHARQEREAFQGQMDTWNEEDTHLRNLLERAKTFEGETTVEGNVVQLKGNERVFLIVRNCPLVEPRRGPGHYQGGYQGISIPIGNTGLRYRVGAGRGTMIPGTEKPTVVDTGVGTITSQRVVFQGPMQTREWSFAKLIGYQNFDDPRWTALAGVEPPENLRAQLRRGVGSRCAVHARAGPGPLQPACRPVRGAARGRGRFPSGGAAERGAAPSSSTGAAPTMTGSTAEVALGQRRFHLRRRAS